MTSIDHLRAAEPDMERVDGHHDQGRSTRHCGLDHDGADANATEPRLRGRTLARLAAWCLALGLLALPVIAVLSGSLASDRWQVRQLDLHAPLQQVSAAQIQAVVEQYTGPGFFALPLAQMRQALDELPWVRSVQVRKRWPDTVLVRVHEHQPYAIWQGSAVVTRTGELVHVPGLAGMDWLPRLDGPADRVIEMVNFHASSVARSAGTPLRIAAVHLSARGSWVIETDDGLRILLGRNLAAERLARFVDTLPTVLASHPDERLQRADLRYPNGYALSWTQVETPSPELAPDSASEQGRPPTAAAGEDHST